MKPLMSSRNFLFTKKKKKGQKWIGWLEGKLLE